MSEPESEEMRKTDLLGYTQKTKHGDVGVQGEGLKNDLDILGLRHWVESRIIY